MGATELTFKDNKSSEEKLHCPCVPLTGWSRYTGVVRGLYPAALLVHSSAKANLPPFLKLLCSVLTELCW